MPFSSRRFYQEEFMGNDFMDRDNGFMMDREFIDRDFPYQNPYFDGSPMRSSPPRNGGMDPEAQRYFRRQGMGMGMGTSMGNGSGNSNGNGNQRYDDFPRSRDPRGRSESIFSNQQKVGQSSTQRYYSAPENVYDAELYRDDEYYDRINDLFPVLSRIQGINWEGSIRYLDGDLSLNRNTNRPVGIRYDLEASGAIFLTITLGSRRIEMRGQQGETATTSTRGTQEGLSHFSQRGSVVRLEPVNEADPNCMILTELSPDTILINEIDRYTGKTVLTASLSIANEEELIQVSHDVGDLDVPIEGHQVWTLSRSGQQRLGSSQFSNQRRQPSTGIPQPLTSSSSQSVSTRGRSAPGAMGRLFPVLSKFAGVTWEGNCRQVNGDLRQPGMPRPLYGGTRYDIFDDGSILLTTFLRSTNGRVQSIEMRGRRVDGAGSPIRLDMERGPNSMIITELAPHTLMMNEVNRETGRILFTASLFLASDKEVVQVSHQVSSRDPRMPIDLHQIWRLRPANDGYENEAEWRDRESYSGRTDRSVDIRGGRSAWPRNDYRDRQAAPSDRRRSINSLLTEPPRRSTNRYDNMDISRDHLWLLNRSPEETRDRFRAKYDRRDGSRDSSEVSEYRDTEMKDLREDHLDSPEMREEFPVLSQIAGIDWKGTCRYIIGDTKPDSILLLNGGMRYDLSPDGVCTMTTNLVFGDGRTREVTMSGYRERTKRFSSSMRLYPLDDDDSVYTILTEISPDTILLNEVDSETDKVIYTASLSLSNDRNELVQVTHELGEGLRMPVEGHQVWRMKRNGGIHEKSAGLKKSGGWVPTSSSTLEERFPVLSKIEGAGWQGTFRFINGDLERQTNFEATGKMWYDLNRNGTCVLTIVSSLSDGSSRYVQMRGERGRSSNAPMRLDPIETGGTNYMIVTELPPDTVLLNEIDRFTGKLVSTASLSVYKDEIIQVSHEMGNSTKLDGHQIARMRRSKERSSASRGSMSYLLNGDLQDDSYGGDSLVELFPVLNQIDGINWQGFCKVVDAARRDERSAPMLSGGMRYDLHRNGTCTMTSVLMHPDGRTHQIKLQGTRVGKSSKRSIRLDPITEDSPFYTVLTEVPPDTILLNEVDKVTNKVIFTASVSIANPDELIQISHDVDARGNADDSHKIWRLKRSPVLGRQMASPSSSFRGQPVRPTPQGRPFRTATPYDSSFGTPDVPFGKPKPKDPNLLFDF